MKGVDLGGRYRLNEIALGWSQGWMRPGSTQGVGYRGCADGSLFVTNGAQACSEAGRIAGRSG